MKTFSTQRLLRGMLPVAMLAVMGAWQAPALALSCAQGSTCVTVDGKGSGAMSTEEARQSKEQWNDTKSLRHKVNTRVEKEFDKIARRMTKIAATTATTSTPTGSRTPVNVWIARPGVGLILNPPAAGGQA
ncbi:putative secreted protein [Serratia marcescens]|nr:putative secreted protein [Serratia marcescens]